VEISVLTVRDNEHNVMGSVGERFHIIRKFPRVRTGQSDGMGSLALNSHLEGWGAGPEFPK